MLLRGSMVILLILGFALFGPPAHSEVADTSVVEIELQDGSSYIGTVVSETDERVVLSVDGVGEITFERRNIKTITEIDPGRMRNGTYWFDNPNATRYLFAPNAIGLRSETGYYQNTWIFFNNVNYGLTDHFSMGVGTVPVFLFGVRALPIWILPKVSYPVNDSFSLATGAMFGGVIGDNVSMGVGLAYGMATYGNRDSNITGTIAYGYQGTRWSRRPFFNLSGMHRLSQTFYLTSENYIFPITESRFDPDTGSSVEETNYEFLFSAGVRWSPESFAVDFALVRPGGIGFDFVGFPWLGVTIPFGR